MWPWDPGWSRQIGCGPTSRRTRVVGWLPRSPASSVHARRATALFVQSGRWYFWRIRGCYPAASSPIERAPRAASEGRRLPCARLPDVNPDSSGRRVAAPPADRAISVGAVRPARTGANKSPTVGVFLSFAWPGLGELYAGARGRAAIFGLPTLAAVVWLAYMALQGLTRLAVGLFDTGTSSVLLVVIVVTGFLRVASIVDTYRILAPARRTRSGGAPAAAAFLVALALVMHGLGGYYAASFYTAGSRIFVGNGDGGAAGGASPDPVASPDPFANVVLPPPADTSARINILLLGADSGMGYDHALTDSQILVSINPKTKTVVMALSLIHI